MSCILFSDQEIVKFCTLSILWGQADDFLISISVVHILWQWTYTDPAGFIQNYTSRNTSNSRPAGQILRFIWPTRACIDNYNNYMAYNLILCCFRNAYRAQLHIPPLHLGCLKLNCFLKWFWTHSTNICIYDIKGLKNEAIVQVHKWFTN